MIIASIAIIILLNLPELLRSKSRGKLMAIYFIIIGSSLFLGILIKIDKYPTSPSIAIMDIVKSLGWGEE